MVKVYDRLAATPAGLLLAHCSAAAAGQPWGHPQPLGRRRAAVGLPSGRLRAAVGPPPGNPRWATVGHWRTFIHEIMLSLNDFLEQVFSSRRFTRIFLWINTRQADDAVPLCFPCTAKENIIGTQQNDGQMQTFSNESTQGLKDLLQTDYSSGLFKSGIRGPVHFCCTTV